MKNFMLKYIHKIKKRNGYMLNINIKNAISQINSKWSNAACPMCGHKTWSASDDIYSPTVIGQNGGLNIGKGLLPLLPVICTNCGNTIFVNIKVLGCIDEDNTQGDSSK